MPATLLTSIALVMHQEENKRLAEQAEAARVEAQRRREKETFFTECMRSRFGHDMWGDLNGAGARFEHQDNGIELVIPLGDTSARLEWQNADGGRIVLRVSCDMRVGYAEAGKVNEGEVSPDVLKERCYALLKALGTVANIAPDVPF